jgi:hypothetical protein
MSELYISIRNRQADIINQNPASIIISRITNVDDGAGGWLPTTSTLASQTVRIYDSTVKDMAVLLVSDSGYHKSRIKKMIALWNSDFEAENETFLDTFSYNSSDYKIVDVKPKRTQDYVVYKEVFIEEIA